MKRETGFGPIVLNQFEYERFKAAGVAYIDDPRYYVIAKPIPTAPIQKVGELLGQPVIVNCREQTVTIGTTVCDITHPYLKGTRIN
jgi:hypothetical protein